MMLAMFAVPLGIVSTCQQGDRVQEYVARVIRHLKSFLKILPSDCCFRLTDYNSVTWQCLAGREPG